MIGVIRKPNIPIIPFNPDSCFDPTTHIATEENFMKLLDNGVYDSKYIGYKVRLSNTSEYNNGLWVIADVNHDSSNTGQTGCYDLISEDCFHSAAFGSDKNWRSSTARTYLNGTFYSGFSSIFKVHMICPKYNSQNTWYTDDYVILPSYKEVNGGTSSYQDNEGIAYPIFTNYTSRKKYQADTTTYRTWWNRSRHTDNKAVWAVTLNGALENYAYGSSLYLAPILRVQ